MRASLLCAAISLLVGAMPGSAVASVMVETSVAELARSASVVARGEIVSTESRRSGDGRRIYTVVKMRVTDAWKGAPAEEVEIRVPGGSVDGIAQVVQGAPRFEPGEEVVVFLAPMREPKVAAGPMRVVAMAQGKLRVTRDEAGVEVAAPDLRGVELIREGARVPAPQVQPRPIAIVELERQVRAVAR